MSSWDRAKEKKRTQKPAFLDPGRSWIMFGAGTEPDSRPDLGRATNFRLFPRYACCLRS